MNSVPRKLTLGLGIALVAAACGDKVTVTNPPTVTPVVRSVIVSPSSATINAGSSFTFGAAVEADAGLTNAVTWSAAGGTGITVDQNGVATASASASGVSSICAASNATGFTNVKGCAQLTVTASVPQLPATVQIDQITVACTLLNGANPSGTACGLLVPVSTSNVFGQIDIKTSVQRPAGSTVTAVRLEILNDVTGVAEGESYTQTLSGDAIGNDGLALQATQQFPITFSVQTAKYDLSGPGGSAKVFWPNGVKRIRVSLIGGTAAATAETKLTFRNANGFHITATGSGGALTSAALNANGKATLQTAATGFSWVGGTGLIITAVPISYTGQAVVASAGTTVNFGNGCDLAFGNRAVAGTVAANGIITGTLAYTAGAGAALGNLNSYEMNPGCATTPELPSAAALDATGNAFINIALGFPFGGNVLNVALDPVNPNLATVTAIRLDNRGPAAIAGFTANPNGRLNGWYNGAVQLNVRTASNVDGVVAGATPADAGFGGTVTLQARGGVCTTVAGCAALPVRTRVTDAPALAETALGSSDNLLVQSLDVFGNFTNSGLNPFGVDVTNPTHTIAQSWAAGVTQFNVQAGSPGNGLLPGTSTWTVTASDVAPALPAVASGIRSSLAAPTGTGSLLLDGLEMILSTRSSTGSNFFCPVNAQFQSTALACVTTAGGSGWTAAGSTLFGRGPGVAIALDPATVPANTPAYYQIVVNAVDEAGNRSTPTTATVIFDNILPTNFGLNTTPVPGVGAGTQTNNVGATDNLDLAFTHFGYTYGAGATLPFSAANAAGFALLYPMATTGSGQQGVSPIGFNQPGPSVLSFSFTQGTTPFMRSLQMVGNTVGGGNTILNAAAAADIAGATVRAVTSDVAGNFTAAFLAIGLTTNAPAALPTPWFTASGIPPAAGAIGFSGAFVTTSSNATPSLGAGTAAQRTVTLTATATSLATAGWQAPFTGGGLDFWVQDNSPGHTGYVKVCTATTPTYNIGTLSWVYSCTWTPGSAIANGYLLPALGATNVIAIGRNATGDGLATQPTAITIIL